MNVALLISSGDGPGECQIAVAKVLDTMRAEADAAGVDLSVAEVAGRHGPVSASVVLGGRGADTVAARWVGTIQWIAPSTIRPGHKRKNWFIGVHRLAGGGAHGSGSAFDPRDVQFSTLRAGGPGGQHQNTTDSAVRAVHRPSGLTVVARSERSQHRNKAAAAERLKALLDVADQQAAASARRGENRLHHALERGNPVRVFKGERFREVGE